VPSLLLAGVEYHGPPVSAPIRTVPVSPKESAALMYVQFSLAEARLYP